MGRSHAMFLAVVDCALQHVPTVREPSRALWWALSQWLVISTDALRCCEYLSSS